MNLENINYENNAKIYYNHGKCYKKFKAYKLIQSVLNYNPRPLLLGAPVDEDSVCSSISAMTLRAGGS